MNSYKKFLIGLLILVIFNQSIYFLNPIMASNSTQELTKITTNSFHINFVDHDPIIIISDDNFTDYGFSGNGSSVNPYLIENLEISSLDHYFIDNGISIEDTTKHFVIQNCLISADTRAIVVTNVTANTAQIKSNSFTECRYGIDFSYAEGIIVRGNNLANCDQKGIYGEHINHNATIINNRNHEHEGKGISVRHCNNITIDSNELINGGSISLSNSSGYIINNLCSSGGGISTGPTDFDQPIYIWNNTCEYCSGSGIFTWDVTEVINNTLNYNDEEGLEVFGRAHIVLNNTIRGNRYGADFDRVYVFSKNKCLRNRNYGLHFQDTHHSYDTNITDNIFFANDVGIHLDYSVDYANISYNLFQENDDYAIVLDGYGGDIRVHHNTFYDNLGGDSQGFDDQSTNLWFDLDAEEGNYWSDWSGEGWYEIDGGNNADIYPLTDPLHERFVDPDPPTEEFPYFFVITFGVVFTIAIIGIVVIILQKRKQKT